MLAAQKEVLMLSPTNCASSRSCKCYWHQAPFSIRKTSPRQPHAFTKRQLHSGMAHAHPCTQQGCVTSLQCHLTNQHEAQIRIQLTPALGSPHVMLRRTPSATRDAFADCCPVRRSLRAIEVSPVKLYFSVTCNCLSSFISTRQAGHTIWIAGSLSMTQIFVEQHA